MCIPLQVPPSPAHGQLEGHNEDIPPPVGGVSGPGRVQDPHHVDMAYQGIVGTAQRVLISKTDQTILQRMAI